MAIVFIYKYIRYVAGRIFFHRLINVWHQRGLLNIHYRK